jgi:hypothetical protein
MNESQNYQEERDAKALDGLNKLNDQLRPLMDNTKSLKGVVALLQAKLSSLEAAVLDEDTMGGGMFFRDEMIPAMFYGPRGTKFGSSSPPRAVETLQAAIALLTSGEAITGFNNTVVRMANYRREVREQTAQAQAMDAMYQESFKELGAARKKILQLESDLRKAKGEPEPVVVAGTGRGQVYHRPDADALAGGMVGADCGAWVSDPKLQSKRPAKLRACKNCFGRK